MDPDWHIALDREVECFWGSKLHENFVMTFIGIKMAGVQDLFCLSRDTDHTSGKMNNELNSLIHLICSLYRVQTSDLVRICSALTVSWLMLQDRWTLLLSVSSRSISASTVTCRPVLSPVFMQTDLDYMKDVCQKRLDFSVVLAFTVTVHRSCLF